MGWAIALHGGAGNASRNMPAARKEGIEAALQQCLHIGISALRSSRSAMDVAELVVRELENNPLFNAGRGSVLTTMGTVEMEASIMDGVTKKCGAVSGLYTVVNPISLARLVMEKTPHIYLAFDGAEDFAKQQGVETVDTSYFITKENKERLQKEKAAHSEQMDHAASTDKIVETRIPLAEANEVYESNGPLGETVGCVVVDNHGHCAAATSTGGRVNKMVGRIGDTPLVGAGNYANHLCAISATGIGEFIIQATVARNVAALMEYKGLTLAEAVNEVIEKHVEKGTTGLVAVSNTGEIAMAFNTEAMSRACADESGYSEMGIWQEVCEPGFVKSLK